MSQITRRHPALRFAVAGAASLLAVAGPAWAQYKYVGPDGRITYSDLPPPSTARVLEQKKRGADGSTGVALPFELQQAVTKYPVTLYTGDKCAPCDEGRSYLRSRGVPFVEKTVTSDEDIALFKQQSPDGTAPVVVVGTQKTVGWSRATLATLLDNAGYPSASTLPRDYQNAAPTPLSPDTKVPGQSVAPGASTAQRAPAAGTPPASTPPAGNPSGFRF